MIPSFSPRYNILCAYTKLNLQPYTIYQVPGVSNPKQQQGDDRAAALYRALSQSPEVTSWNLSPRMYPLHTLDPHSILGQEAASTGLVSTLRLPPYLPVSSEKLDPTGAFLVENGLDAFVYLGQSAPPELCMALIGAPYVEDAHHQVGCCCCLVCFCMRLWPWTGEMYERTCNLINILFVSYS